MEVIAKEIRTTEYGGINLYPLGDIHAGAIQCAERSVGEQVQAIKADKFGYWVGMGDMADCILNKDPRMDAGGLAPWVQRTNIAESQRRWLKALLKPISGKCLGLLEGNHEATIHKYHDCDMTRNLCDDLEVPYAGGAAYIELHFVRGNSNDRRVTVVHAWHGSGSAVTYGARLNRLMRLVNEFQADVYLMGHLHDVVTYCPSRIVLGRNGRIKSVNLVAAITGAWLKGYAQAKGTEHFNPSYVEQKGYPPNRIGCPVVHIRPFQNELSIESPRLA